MEIIDIEKKSKTMRGKRNRISKLSIDHIAIVTEPAVGSAKFFLFKFLEEGSLDLNDPEVWARLEREIQNLTPEEKVELEKVLEKLDDSITLTLMEKDFDRLQKEDSGLARLLKTDPERINWSLGKGFFLKEEYKLKKEYTLSADKKRYYDLDRRLWCPVKKEK